MTNLPIKVFISQPMNGRKEIDILLEREIIRTFLIEADLGVDFEVIDQCHVPETEIPKGSKNVWLLGRSIQLMDSADVVIFADEWRKAKGCLVEKLICVEYNIPTLHMKDLPNLKDRRHILLIDINKRRVTYGRKEIKT